MSENVGQLFKDWMVATGKSKNTASNYLTGVNTVSNHCGRDVFAIDDLDELERLYLLYGPKGEHAAIGASNSGNVQSGLKQWLDFQRQHRQHVGVSAANVAIAGYADQRVLQLLGKGTPDEQAWCWTLLKYFRQRYPKADHWTVNINPPDIRVGVREKESLKGKPAFTLYWYGGAICCSVRGIADHRALMEAQGLDWEIDSSRCPTLADMRSWFDSVERALRGRQLTLNGAGLVPSDYGQAEQEESSVTTTNTAYEPALNQILFGPPGTGKTYHTINQALAILAPEFLTQNSGNDPETRKRLKAEFDRFVTAEQVRFVTFHQSFSYEDFVEGLRADSDTETGQVKYSVESGVFKRLCDDARTRPVADLGVRGNPAIWKISINGTGSSPTKSYCLDNGEARIGWGNTGSLQGDAESNAYYQSLSTRNKGTLNCFAEQMVVGDILLCIHSAEQIGSIGVVTSDYRYEEQVPAGVLGDYQHVRSVRWLYRDINLSVLPLNDGHQFTQKTVYAIDRFTWGELFSYLQQKEVQPVESVTMPGSVNEPYVLIIDEINRGNVSRIFGELITLIEESKREGADEALSVKLPYSKKPFSVPKNVYLIGTMNTADRSLAGLDIALRRRFVFREMPPRPDLLKEVLVQGLNIGQLLEKMNQRIEVLLDRDHALGHAYFMSLKDDSSLARLELIFRNQILPLLQEYFFEDWQRIGWVLNDQNASANGTAPFIRRPQSELNLADLFGSGVAEKLTDQRWELNHQAFSSLASYQNIVG